MAGEFKIKNGVVVNNTQPINNISTDGTLVGNSDMTVPTEKAIKTYVDGKTTTPGLQAVTDVDNKTTNDILVGDTSKNTTVTDGNGGAPGITMRENGHEATVLFDDAASRITGNHQLHGGAEYTPTDNKDYVQKHYVDSVVADIGVLSARYKFTTSTTGDPTTGHAGIDNATVASATHVNISYTDQGGHDRSYGINSLQDKDYIALEDRNTTDHYTYMVIGNPVNNTTYATIPVQFVSEAGTLNNNENITAEVVFKGAKEFTDLLDTPSDYTGEAGKVVAVNAAEDGVEFITAPSGNPSQGAGVLNVSDGSGGWIERHVGLNETATDITLQPQGNHNLNLAVASGSHVRAPEPTETQDVATKNYVDTHGGSSLWEVDGNDALKPTTDHTQVSIGTSTTGIGKLEVHVDNTAPGGIEVINAESGYDGIYNVVTTDHYSMDATHHLVDTGWYWVMCSDPNDAWNTGIAQGAGGLTTPAAVTEYTALGGASATPLVSNAVTNVIEAITTNGKVFSEQTIKTLKDFNVNEQIIIGVNPSGENVMGLKDAAGNGIALDIVEDAGGGATNAILRLNVDGTAKLPACTLAEITENDDIATKEYVDNKGGLQQDGSIDGSSVNMLVLGSGPNEVKVDAKARVSYWGADDRTYYTTYAHRLQLGVTSGDVEVVPGPGDTLSLGMEFDDTTATGLRVDRNTKTIVAQGLNIDLGGDKSLVTKEYVDGHTVGGMVIAKTPEEFRTAWNDNSISFIFAAFDGECATGTFNTRSNRLYIYGNAVCFTNPVFVNSTAWREVFFYTTQVNIYTSPSGDIDFGKAVFFFRKVYISATNATNINTNSKYEIGTGTLPAGMDKEYWDNTNHSTGGSGSLLSSKYYINGTLPATVVLSRNSGSSFALGFHVPTGSTYEIVGMNFLAGSFGTGQATTAKIRVAAFDSPNNAQYTYGGGTTLYQGDVFSSTGAAGTQYYGVTFTDLSASPVTLTSGKMVMVEFDKGHWDVTDLTVDLMIRMA